ncbi:MAG: pyruvate dehydrogenase (acetyl-transferring), homodimeric type [Gammaproteobacteria bacterium]|jgi:pyruvate dehydrogenase E1 component|nr:pyruvate dehydrogenase (acetyl-transferring), homodimeric type [Gammaproteobacteria bacterium]MDP7154480.1 pyruvate dehydrogenase (acetyl-transferring), homodimeric type [Gammaproteobacteria bacterium]MDP7296692.1 pyruvate dehydrogenase (acetyl-transferring), homodimeric type [Gammaproteobacteria bacterium]MDP7418936.1 pyruvate dehydrogenase (acetyl-transferring), homodimeric type [Gammaproteobacteria bacterium]MDP7660819.1 pyruvate dehydrogenase (acetyl-transferring), homodimeric type [Gamm
MASRRNEIEAQDIELQEWLESMDSLLRAEGPERAKIIFKAVRDFLADENVIIRDATLNTPYRNSIPLDQQPAYPGDIAIEQRIENILRWNAMAMVLRGYDSGTGVGGHIGTYASSATMMEVGLNHFFRNKSDDYGGDLVGIQAHSAPGVYARAFLEGRLSLQQLHNFRRELQTGGGLPSYPHPRNLPGFWQMPSASMGLSTPTAIYQARFAKYLERRGLKPNNGGKIWLFIGDGESDEPEVLGTINIAAREKLDNLIMVVNCNLQRLDGPVRGNGKIIQELERSFRGAGWNVLKVIWSGEWDKLFAIDYDGELQDRMEQAVDGDYQMYSVSSGEEVRTHWVGDNQNLANIMRILSDEEIRCIRRGGHDHKKIYATFEQATRTQDGPTVILIKTIKGYGMQGYEGSNAVHQKKNLSANERVDTARRLGIPISDDAAKRAEFYLPPTDSEELAYLNAHRAALGGPWPNRSIDCATLKAPDLDLFKDQVSGSGEREQSTTMAFVRMLAKLLDHPELGRYIVPIVPDEARTFGMEALFRKVGIYSAEEQKYRPVDSTTLMPYREVQDGQILQEGICEAGAMASFLAAGTAYAIHGIPTIPFYVFYSIFGFQRVGDMIWSCGDMLSRGFLLGGTSGRTTLNGEGLQHEDGQSQITANTVPNLLSYDPAFAYELAVIIRDGIRRMYDLQEEIFYYITIHNENYVMPPMPDNSEDGIVKGMYCFARSTNQVQAGRKAHLFGSGAIMTEILKARDLLETYGISTDIWSVTSYNELSREGLATERVNLLQTGNETNQPYVSKLLNEEQGVFIAASDYQKSLPLSIARWIPGPYVVLGTDGFGLSESRPDLRTHFEVSAEYIAYAALAALAEQNAIPAAELEAAAAFLKIDQTKPNAATSGPPDYSL